MTDIEDRSESATARIKALEVERNMLKAQNSDLRNTIRDQVRNYNRTGRRLVALGVLLLILLGAVTIPLAFAVYTGIHAFIEESPGGLVLPGAIVGIGIAVAGVFYAAAKMLGAIPAILNERNHNAEKLLKTLQSTLGASESERPHTSTTVPLDNPESVADTLRRRLDPETLADVVRLLKES